MLHKDTGQAEIFEYNGLNHLDPPLMSNNKLVTDSFQINKVPDGPAIVAYSQSLQDGIIYLKHVRIENDGFVVAHRSNSTKDGPVLSTLYSVPIYLKAGTYQK